MLEERLPSDPSSFETHLHSYESKSDKLDGSVDLLIHPNIENFTLVFKALSSSNEYGTLVSKFLIYTPVWEPRAWRGTVSRKIPTSKGAMTHQGREDRTMDCVQSAIVQF